MPRHGRILCFNLSIILVFIVSAQALSETSLVDWLRSIGHKLSSLQKHDEKPQTLPPSAVSGLSKRDADPDASRPSDPTNADEPVACPYCDFVINPPPARSRKCPSCKQAIAMRSTYGSSPIWRDGVTRTRLFMTLEQAESFDAAAAEASSRMNAITTAQRFGCSTTDFTRKQASLHKASAENVSPQGVLLALLASLLLCFLFACMMVLVLPSI